MTFVLEDLGDRRALTVDGRTYVTYYSARLVRMLIARKGPHRAPLYFPFKETRGRHFLGPLVAHLRARGCAGLSVLEVGCSFGHVTEFLAEQPEIGGITAFDTDPEFVAMVQTKVDELDLRRVHDVRLLEPEATRRLPWPDGAFDVVLAIGVIEHLPERMRRAQVDEYYRLVAPGGLIAVLDTPNRVFPLETHSVGLPFVQWLPPRLAHRYARALRRRTYGSMTFADFTADGGGWRNASLADCLPSVGRDEFEDVTEALGYGWRFFRETARSRTRRALLPAFAITTAMCRAFGGPPSLALPYFNLVFRRRGATVLTARAAQPTIGAR
jgi:SAM-dependent methyltransferase